jgi:hypothetical protein
MAVSRRLALLNVVFLGVAGFAGTYIVRELGEEPPPRAVPARGRAAPAPLTAVAPAQSPAETAVGGDYAVVATRNLFSPTRSEAPPAAGQAGRPNPAASKPNLYGIILREGMPVAYLEDPATKRVAGYRLGDTIAGGTVEAIHADRVVLARPDGAMDVRLRDPSKPRPVATPPQPQPGQPRLLPGVVPPQPGATPTIQPGIPTAPGIPVPRRPLPPSVLRRVPPVTSDVPQQ